MKKSVSLAMVLVIALSLSLPVCAGDAENTGEVQKYGDIGRLSKLNITEDELNEVLKDIMVDSICNRRLLWKRRRMKADSWSAGRKPHESRAV